MLHTVEILKKKSSSDPKVVNGGVRKLMNPYTCLGGVYLSLYFVYPRDCEIYIVFLPSGSEIIKPRDAVGCDGRLPCIC